MHKYIYINIYERTLPESSVRCVSIYISISVSVSISIYLSVYLRFGLTLNPEP